MPKSRAEKFDPLGKARSLVRSLWDGARAMTSGVVFAEECHLKPFKHGKDLTNSARSTFLTCPQKYQYSYIYGLAPRKPSIPFLVGGLFHDELDRMYSTGKADPEGTAERAGKACEAACKFPGMRSEDSDNIWMQQAIVCGMIKGYASLYLKHDLKEYQILETEGQFVAPIPESDWTYRGKKDMVVMRKKDSKLILMEHKTAGRIDAGYVAKLPMDNQILGYGWAQRAETGRKFSGVLYNVTKKPQIRQKQTESLQQFMRRVEDDYYLNPGAYFYRELLTFTDADLDRFGKELKRFVLNIERAQKENDFFQNAGACTQMGTCPFMKLCLDGVNKDTLLHYRIKSRAHEELPVDTTD
jgi:hypothetical protein